MASTRRSRTGFCSAQSGFRAAEIPARRHPLRDFLDGEKEAWDAVEWDEEGNVPAQVELAAVNKWLFNADTVDKALERLMTEGLKVADGDRLGKTIIFAKNHDHAAFIVERFDVNYPHLKGSFARVIDFKTEYAQSLIDDFSQSEKPPHIAVSVDMLDTGIDVPEVVNLVFFKIVRVQNEILADARPRNPVVPRSVRPGPAQGALPRFRSLPEFRLLQNQNPELADGATRLAEQAPPPSACRHRRKHRQQFKPIEPQEPRRVSASRDAVSDASEAGSAVDVEAQHRELRGAVADRLLARGNGAMSVDNFIVRRKRRYV